MRPARLAPFLLLLASLGLAGCGAPARSIDRVHAGMDRSQVLSMMGPPDTVVHSAGKDCAYYDLLRDFWSRVPWSMSERYVVCYHEGKVETFGKVAATSPG